MYNLNTGVVAVGSVLSTVVLTVILYRFEEKTLRKREVL